MSEELLYELREEIGVVTFNRPEARNALTFAMYEGLAELCAREGHRRRGCERGGQQPDRPAPGGPSRDGTGALGPPERARPHDPDRRLPRERGRARRSVGREGLREAAEDDLPAAGWPLCGFRGPRSDECRVGKEGVSMCRSGGWSDP